MVKELQNILQYQVWTPLSKETLIDDAIRLLMIVVENILQLESLINGKVD